MNDKIRWNEKHKNPLMPSEPSAFVQKFLHDEGIGKTALDIACGTGRHTHYLADLGYHVDAVDISDYGLSQIRLLPNINIIEADLSAYSITPDTYDVIVNINYLERQLFPSILTGLKDNGILIFETFVDAESSDYAQPSNPNYLLRSYELPNFFRTLSILEYREYDSMNIHGEKVKIASIAAQSIKHN